MPMSKHIHVAVGVILRNDTCYITQRSADVHQGGKWEFPGGKIESGESVFSALQRELQEEVGIAITGSNPLQEISHDYGDKAVTLHVHTVADFTGEPFGKEGQHGQWVKLSALVELDFPAANQVIIAALQPPKDA